MSLVIPIQLCFDNNYVIPASVAFYSLMQHANTAYQYKIYVLHSDITVINQEKLRQTILGFKNVSVTFINMEYRFNDLFENTKSKGHYTKEMFYKFLAPSIFPDHEKILVSDVDVVFRGDVSRDFLDFDVKSDFFLSGSQSLVKRGSWVEQGLKSYEHNFTSDEIKSLKVGAGYYVANLLKMREDGLEEKFIRFANDNIRRLLQPEQDVLNLVCFPNIKILPADSMVCTYSYDFYKSEDDFENDLHFNAEEVKHALAHPIQLHYAGSVKPWTSPGSLKSQIWFEVLTHTPFFSDHLFALGQSIEKLNRQKVLFSFKWPFSRRRIVVSRVKVSD